MSKIGRKPISLPQGVTIEVQPTVVTVKGPKGTLTAPMIAGISVELKETQVFVTRNNDEKQTKANHGLIRSLVNNCIIGVEAGFKKTLKLVGTGYRATAKGKDVSLALGYSHPIEFKTPEGVKVTVEGNDTIHVEGADKQKVGQVSANLRELRPPEPYKGKGIRYVDEVVRRKQGKAAA